MRVDQQHQDSSFQGKGGHTIHFDNETLEITLVGVMQTFFLLGRVGDPDVERELAESMNVADEGEVAAPLVAASTL